MFARWGPFGHGGGVYGSLAMSRPARVGVRAVAGRKLPAIALVVAVCVIAAAGGASSTVIRPRGPLPIQASSLTQSGEELVWHVVLDDPFSPGRLARQGRSLCLLVERVNDGAVIGRACVVGPSPGSRAPRIRYTPVGGFGALQGEVVDATVRRTSSRDLTASFVPSALGLGYRDLRWQTISTLRQSACAPPVPGPAGCFRLLPARPRLLKLHEPQLAGCVAHGPRWVFNGPTAEREVALTFDDGPWVQTPKFLDVLEREHVVATFFQIGDQISTYGARGLDSRMLADGDVIGDHTWNYGGDVAAGRADAVKQISEAAAAIRKATGGFEPCLFRAPGGHVTPRLLRTARSLGFTTVQWNVDPRDWARPGTRAIYSNVIRNVRDGAIVIQHDGGGDRSQTLAALPREIETLHKEGYTFVTVTQMLGYKLVYR
jgi:peptidoglycan/xylan/chitin deacetylase (PgdA/CDA1 family)